MKDTLQEISNIKLLLDKISPQTLEGVVIAHVCEMLTLLDRCQLC